MLIFLIIDLMINNINLNLMILNNNNNKNKKNILIIVIFKKYKFILRNE